MANPLPGAQVARDLGIPLGQLYSWVKRGLVTNHKEGGYPEGKGLEVDPIEAKLAWTTSKKKGPRSAPRKAREPKVRNEEGVLVAAPAAKTKKLRTGEIISFDSGKEARSTFNPKKGPRYTVAQVLGANGRLTYLDEGSHRVHYTGAQIDNVIFSTERLALMMAKGIARVEKPVMVLGMILLSFIMEGKMELAESLEAWMIENELEVHVPELIDLPMDEGEESFEVAPAAETLAGDDDEE